MTWRQHVAEILMWLEGALVEKYEAGQREHGGHLWEKPCLLRHAEEEVLDLIVYVRTVRTQCEEALRQLKAGKPREAAQQLEHLLRGDHETLRR